MKKELRILKVTRRNEFVALCADCARINFTLGYIRQESSGVEWETEGIIYMPTGDNISLCRECWGWHIFCLQFLGPKISTESVFDNDDNSWACDKKGG